MSTDDDLDLLRQTLTAIGPVVVACSGGIDSLLLATVAHRNDPGTTVVATLPQPYLPITERRSPRPPRRWDLRAIRREFDDERYLANPTDRCYLQTNLYDAVDELRAGLPASTAIVVSGANTDDLGEYRPGLVAAAEHEVRHPYVEAGIGKDQIRAIARQLGLPEAELPASPCLASRLYTGTRVTPTRLVAVHAGEEVLRAAGFDVVRCRRRDSDVLVEVPEADRPRLDQTVLDAATAAMRAVDPEISAVTVDTRPYRPGQAVLVKP